MDLQSVIESLIFAADTPLTKRQLRTLTGAEREELEPCLEALCEIYAERGVQLVEISGGYQFRTHPDNGDAVKQLLAGRPVRLSRAMLEVLAIVAYRQPVTRPEIDEIRGVDCGSTLRVLLERDLIRILGKKEEPGRPLLYGSTKYFLEFFNLKDLRELPSLKEFTELSDDHAKQVDEQFGGGPPTIIDQDAGAEQSTPGATFAAGSAKVSADIGATGEPAPSTYADTDEDAERALDALDAAMERAGDVLESGKPKAPPEVVSDATGDEADAGAAAAAAAAAKAPGQRSEEQP